MTIRLLDPPLHEFLPQEEEGIREVAAALGADVGRVRAKIEALREFNPMLGPSRLPPRHHLPGDLPDAGARHRRGGAARSRRRA